MQAAAAAIMASKADIQQRKAVLHEFPMAKHTQYIELKGEETQSKQKDVDLKKEQLETNSQRFGWTQKKDEHSLRMDRERAELEDRSAKRRRFDAGTDDGITFKSLLAKAAKGSGDAKAFEDKGRKMSLGLEVYKAFKQHITGNHKPLQNNTEATDAIAKFVANGVAAGSNGAVAKDLRNCFIVVPRHLVDAGELYN